MQIRWQYCKDLNDINQAIRDYHKNYPDNENWEGLYTADNIINITYDTNHGCYVVFWKAGNENRWGM